MANKQWQHNPVGMKVGAPPAAGDPACFAWESDHTQHVVYRGADNQIHELWYRHGKDWSYGGALSMKTGAQPAAGNPDGYAWEHDNTQHIIYRGLDNQVHELWQRRGQDWKYGGALNARLSAPLAASDPVGYAWEGDNTQHILYQGVDNQIHELWQRHGDQWKYGGQLNARIGAPATAGNPAGFAWEEDHTQHVIYRGTDNQIHELWQRQGKQWQYDGAMSLRLGAPAAAGDPMGYEWGHDRTQHLLYRGMDNMIHELWFRIGQGWKYGGALNARAGGPAAQSNPTGFAWNGDDTQHVVYQGVDTQIHELWQRRGKDWEYGGALNVVTGGGVAAGKPDGFAWEDDNTQHIVYRGADNYIHEIWFRK